MATKALNSKSTAVAVKKVSSSNIVDIKALLAKEVASIAERVNAPGGDAINVAGKRFTMPDGTKSDGPVQLVIVDFVSVNTYYEGAYDKDSIAPPACFAIGTNPASMTPSKNAPVAQASACSSCPMNQFGSSGNGKACKNTRVLAVLPPDANADTPLWILKVSPTGLKSFDSYVTSVARSFQLPPVGVVTEVSFDDNVTYPSLRFGNPTPNEDLTGFFSRKEEAKARLLVEPDVSQYEAPAPAKKAMPPRRK